MPITRCAVMSYGKRGGWKVTTKGTPMSISPQTIHRCNGQPIGATRLDDLGNGRGAVRLVAIATGTQRRGHGRILSALVEQYARELGLTTLFVNAVPGVVGYYEKMGWNAGPWDEAELVGIAVGCKQMSKPLLRNS